MAQPDAVRPGLPARDGESTYTSTVFDARDRAFAFSRGACTHGLYDNMNAAMEAMLVGRKRSYNRWFLHMCSHDLVELSACTPSSGWERGQVENQVGLVRGEFLAPRLRVRSYKELSAALPDRCVAHARAHRHPELRDRTIWWVVEAERQSLVPDTGRFSGFHAVMIPASTPCRAVFDTRKYSVAAGAVGRSVEIRACAGPVSALIGRCRLPV